jgi:hypothetical protein
LSRLLLVALLALTPLQSFALTNLQCKITAIKNEADQNNIRDKKMVLQVVTNRSRLQRLSPCNIVLAKSQFSFVSKRTNWKFSEKDLQEYWKVVEYHPVVGKDVVSFHRNDVRPSWSKKMQRRGRVGKHFVYSKLKEK